MFVAYYSKKRLIGLAGIGLLFLTMGIVLIIQPDGSFDHPGQIAALGLLLGGNNDLAGHGLGWVVTLFGAAVFPIIAKQITYSRPAMRIDDKGIYWHHWSAKPIGWSNIRQIREGSVGRQRFVTLTLRDPTLDPSTSLQAKLARINNMMGFGHVSLTELGIDKTHEELLEAVRFHAARHEHTARAAAGASMHSPAIVTTRRTFGRKRQ
jgi:hypothetical protein